MIVHPSKGLFQSMVQLLIREGDAFIKLCRLCLGRSAILSLTGLTA